MCAAVWGPRRIAQSLLGARLGKRAAHALFRAGATQRDGSGFAVEPHKPSHLPASGLPEAQRCWLMTMRRSRSPSASCGN